MLPRMKGSPFALQPGVCTGLLSVSSLNSIQLDHNSFQHLVGTEQPPAMPALSGLEYWGECLHHHSNDHCRPKHWAQLDHNSRAHCTSAHWPSAVGDDERSVDCPRGRPLPQLTSPDSAGRAGGCCVPTRCWNAT